MSLDAASFSAVVAYGVPEEEDAVPEEVEEDAIPEGPVLSYHRPGDILVTNVLLIGLVYASARYLTRSSAT